MKLIRVLGIGSPFADDRLGWKAIDLLKKRSEIQSYLSKQFQLKKCDRPGVGLLDLIQGAETVFMIDALKTGEPEGTIYRLQNEEIENAQHVLSSHGLGIGQAISLGKALSALPQKIIFYGIEIIHTENVFHVSSAIKSALLILVNQLIEELMNLGSVYDSSFN